MALPLTSATTFYLSSLLRKSFREQQATIHQTETTFEFSLNNYGLQNEDKLFFRVRKQ